MKTEKYILNIETGEVLGHSLIAKREKQLKSHMKELEKDAALVGMPLKSKLTVKRANSNLTNIRKGTPYVSTFKNDFIEILLKLEPLDRAILMMLICYIQYPSNMVEVNKEPPTIATLSKLSGTEENFLSERKVKEVLKRIEYYDVIKRVRIYRKTLIYFNPKYFASGTLIEASTVKMFDHND